MYIYTCMCNSKCIYINVLLMKINHSILHYNVILITFDSSAALSVGNTVCLEITVTEQYTDSVLYIKYRAG